jgi:hypothetical protein
MHVEAPPRARPSTAALLLLVAMLIVLGIGDGNPASRDAVGLSRLASKVRWTASWVLLRYADVLPLVAARHLLALDPSLETREAKFAATILARRGRPDERVRWSAALVAEGVDASELLRAAIAAALGTRTTDCATLRRASRAVATLPGRSPLRRELALALRRRDGGPISRCRAP